MEFNEIIQNFLGDPFANIPMRNIDIGRESLPAIEFSSSFGRESLGLLKTGCDNYLNNQAQFENGDVSNNILDQAFLLSSQSDIRSGSFLKYSFNINGNEQISDATSNLDYSVLYSTVERDKFYMRSRFNSLPIFTNNNEEEKGIMKQILIRASEGCQINCDTVEEESEFNDSVFIEARHLATKFNGEETKDGFILDDTDPPELINGDLENEDISTVENIKCSSEEVFKKIDKLLPVSDLQQLQDKLDNLIVDPPKHMNGDLLQHKKENSSYSPKTETECNIRTEERMNTNQIIKEQIVNVDKKPIENSPSIQLDNLNEVPCEIYSEKDSVQNNKCVEIKTNEAEKILQALSVIFAKSVRSEQETQKGKGLLNTLSKMLSSNSNEKNESVKLHEKSTGGSTKQNGVSTKVQEFSHKYSTNSGSQQNNRKHSNSFSFQNKTGKTKFKADIMKSPSWDGSKSRNYVSSAESSVEVRNHSSDNPNVNLKLKKSNSVAVRRGPMKATVPMPNIIKPHIKGTPTKANHVNKLKTRISTPIRDLHIKPMAQSTPDNKVDNSSSSMELTNVRSMSSNMPEKSYRSNSTTSVSSYRDSLLSKDRSHISQLPRRNSVSECRKSSTPEVKKSSSIKESSLMKAMSKIRQNISASKGPLRDCSNISSRENFTTSGKIIITPKRMVRAVGKENTSAVC